MLSCYKLDCRIALIRGERGRDDFADLDEFEQLAWQYTFNEMLNACQEPAAGATYAGVGETIYLAYMRYRQTEAVPWEGLPLAERLRWQALVRHLMNLLVLVESEDGTAETHEERMALWYEAKTQESQLPEQVVQAQKEANEFRDTQPQPAASPHQHEPGRDARMEDAARLSWRRGAVDERGRLGEPAGPGH
jgi:hypothetical protein